MSRRGVLRRHAAVVLVASMLVGVGFLQATGRLQDVLSAHEAGKRDRVVMWGAALGMIRARPLLGHGVNTFMANYLDYWVGGERQPRYAHNCYLQVAAETGLVGLAAFLWLLWLQVRQMASAIRRRPSAEASLLLGLLAGLVAFLAQSAMDTNFYALRQAALFWTLAGVGVGMSIGRAADERARA